MFWILLTGCALTTRQAGLLEVDSQRLLLHQPSGKTVALVPGADDPELHHLGGCTIEVEGTRIMGRLTVRKWRVTDAGDGSQPFIGQLTRPGSQYFLQDWNTGTTLILNPESIGLLSDHVGDTVLIVGFVSGAQEVSVVSWRSLSEQ